MTEERPRISVCLITYNHAAFVRDALDGILSQRVDGVVEIVVADDASSDGTQDILRAYAADHPGRFNLLLRAKNVGPAQNWMGLLAAARGKYIAYSDGDDYWCSPHKLRMQAEALDADPRAVLCFHDVWEVEDGRPRRRALGPDFPRITGLRDVLAGNYIPSCTIFYRNDAVRPETFPPWFHSLPVGDWPQHVLHAEKGHFIYLPDPLAVYRRHSSGTWSSQKQAKVFENRLRAYEVFRAHLGGLHTDVLDRAECTTLLELARLHALEGRRRDALRPLRSALQLVSPSDYALVRQAAGVGLAFAPRLRRVLRTAHALVRG